MANNSTFATGGGIVTTDFGATDDRINGIVVQPDGKILAVGYSANTGGTSYSPSNNIWYVIALARYNTDGSLDASFDGDGKLTTSTQELGFDISSQADGKILVASGTAASTLIRYNSNGNLDNTFDLDGIVNSTVLGNTGFSRFRLANLATQPDEKILLSDASGVARYNTNGTLDTTFGANGFLSAPSDMSILDLASQRDGKILASGTIGVDLTFGAADIVLVRYNNDGSLDSTFGTNGKVFTDFAREDSGLSIAIQSDGRIIVAGSTRFDNGDKIPLFAVARYNTDGSLDASFDGDGKLTQNLGDGYSYATSVVVQTDGKILVAGDSGINGKNVLVIARYNVDGSLDRSFDGDGIVVSPAAMAFGGTTYVGGARATLGLQADGKILLSGTSHSGSTNDFFLARYNTDGSLDTGLPRTNTPLLGTNASESFMAAVGDDTIDGGNGIDTTIISGSWSSYTLTRTVTGNTVKHNAGKEGTDTLSNIERLQFSDKKIALDLTPDGNAGKALEFIGMMAHNLVNTPTVVGTILSIFDQGKSMKEVCQLAIDVGLTGQLAGSTSNLDLAKLVFRNVIGSEASAGDATYLASFIQGNGGSMTQADFLTAIAQLDLNNQHIGLVGLQSTGVEYIV